MNNDFYIKKIILLIFLVAFLSFSTGCFNKTTKPEQIIDYSTEGSSELSTVLSTELSTDASTEVSTEVSTSNDNIDTNNVLLEANIKDWKLGDELIAYVGSNRTYDWYLDQAHTGEHAVSNCGPTSVAMAAKWADASFVGTAEVAREAFRSEGGWWYNDDIEGSLKLFNVDYEMQTIEGVHTLRSIIDSGRIAIINNSMGYITRETDVDAHTNRFYEFDSGHYFIIKGYALVDEKTYFEVYDPNTWDMTYEDGTPMGKDRYYEASVLMASIDNWYPYAIIINPQK